MRKEKMFNLLLSAATIIVFLLLAELGLRIYTSVSKQFDIEMLTYAKKLKRKSSIPGLSHEHIPGAEAEVMRTRIKINNHGFRGNPIQLEKKPNEHRILVLGSSITIGWGVPFEEVFTTRLEKKLNTQPDKPEDKHYTIINSGIANYNTVLEAIYFKKKLYRFQPDTVILHYFLNDAEILSSEGSGFLVRHSHLVAVLYNRIKQAIDTKKNKYTHIGEYYRDLYLPDSPGWQQAQKAILDIDSFCKESGMRFIVLIQPDLHNLAKNSLQDACHLTITQFLTRHRIGYCDLLPAFRKRFGADPRAIWVNPDDSHPDSQGHKLMFEELFKYLKENSGEI